MRKKLYVIYDEVAKISLNPFPANNESDAIRTFEFTLSSNPLMNYRKGDFALRTIGTFDVSDGCLVFTGNCPDGSDEFMTFDVIRGNAFESDGD